MKYNKDNPLRIFEAFAGYGSQSMALERLKKDFPSFDYKVVGISEIDKYAIQAYNAVHEGVQNYGDISKIDWNKVPDFDLITTSFPCQDISLAGMQKGLTRDSGTRSSLIWECERAIDIKRPKYILMENVKALVSKKFIKDFERWGDVLRSKGYVNFWQVLNAKDYGVPQNRERVFMLSIMVTEDDPFPKYNFPRPFPLQKKLKDVLETNVDEKYYLSDKAVSGFMKTSDNKEHCHKFAPKNGEDTAFTIRTKAGSRVDDNFINENNIGGGIRQRGLNTSVGNVASTLKANYYKMGKTNFLGDVSAGRKATCVLEENETEET